MGGVLGTPAAGGPWAPGAHGGWDAESPPPAPSTGSHARRGAAPPAGPSAGVCPGIISWRGPLGPAAGGRVAPRVRRASVASAGRTTRGPHACPSNLTDHLRRLPRCPPVDRPVRIRRTRLGGVVDGRDHGKGERPRGPLVHRALGPEPAAVPVDEALHGREAEARAGTFRVAVQALERCAPLLHQGHVTPRAILAHAHHRRPVRRRLRPHSRRAWAVVAVNFQAVLKRLSSTICRNRGSPYAVRPSAMTQSTWQGGWRWCRSAATTWARALRSTTCHWSAWRDTPLKARSASMSTCMRCVAASMWRMRCRPSASSCSAESSRKASMTLSIWRRGACKSWEPAALNISRSWFRASSWTVRCRTRCSRSALRA
jgi:hypothetical protein